MAARIEPKWRCSSKLWSNKPKNTRRSAHVILVSAEEMPRSSGDNFDEINAIWSSISFLGVEEILTAPP